jgi:hypothetical protein
MLIGHTINVPKHSEADIIYKHYQMGRVKIQQNNQPVSKDDKNGQPKLIWPVRDKAARIN